MYPIAYKTAERVTNQATRETCINQLQRAFAKALRSSGRGGAIRSRIAPSVPVLIRDNLVIFAVLLRSHRA